ncbi:MAG: FCD domain-containing protein [Gammaproteobacteria bacterium]|jgi:GntR family uxuAB operon transcriptional repressor|uniref:Transcriptional regulator, GntR family n=1 Tax=Marinomonas polaris DSM 16579 TaxID=1122206 RepID=A0A1M5DPF1_9GAMM|nr:MULTISPECIES: FCD domain-containing protein [Marinomonas]MBU1293180.1 FCD domain-containing protein [Gammaproteobacteria bacterium]MBU1465435.1 FCD domain-containing protein [Gammaproteobacteria bacterium]MBU2023916.1 FCD domain-containing protein [Gammaproteobacteria bacterium]MBU2236964.1 FCD domain-containing protein [Gammaproteobacteria bacterium]MBU2320179.1 FCD domain-containing protein [Gammaproteobacteria bacterium]|tara:strand:- start:10483 stop:11259 length:777 start_codon:yes stop_codon:yes gene_type:complete
MINTLVKPKRLYQEVGLKLYEELRQGQYKVGDRLPPERDIAEQLGVSRTLLREALIMLELMEIVEVRKGSGIYLLKQPTNIKSSDKFEESLDNDDVGPFEMMQARQLLESHVAEFAATQATKKDIIKMRDALELEKQNIDTADQNHAADKLFHLAIAEATQNSVLVDLVENLWERRENSPMWKQLHSHITDQAYRKKWLVDHENILLAIQQKKPDIARMAMWRHLENVKDTLMLLSEHQDPNFDGYLFSTNPVQLPCS